MSLSDILGSWGSCGPCGTCVTGWSISPVDAANEGGGDEVGPGDDVGVGVGLGDDCILTFLVFPAFSLFFCNVSSIKLIL